MAPPAPPRRIATVIKTAIAFALGTWLGVNYTHALTATCPRLRELPLSILRLEEVTIAGKLCKPY
jgi:hypothetical protein